MNKNKIFEFFFGFATIFAIIIIGVFFFKEPYKKIGQNKYTSYYAVFDDIDGVYIGSDIKIAGINIGFIENILINKNFQAEVKINIIKDYKISEDSMIIVATSGFLGSKYLKIIPGYKENFLNENEFFQFTQSSINLENILGFLKK